MKNLNHEAAKVAKEREVNAKVFESETFPVLFTLMFDVGRSMFNVQSAKLLGI